MQGPCFFSHRKTPDSMTELSQLPPPRRPWAGLALSLALALLFLAGCLWWGYNEIKFLIPNDRIAASLSIEQALGSTLIWQLAAFAGALLLCHLLLGLAAFGLARLTEAALPNTRIAHRNWLIAGWFTLLAGAVLAANSTWHVSSVFADEVSWLRRETSGLYPVEWLLLAMALGLLVLSFRVVLRIRPAVSGRGAAVVGSVLVASAIGYLLPAALVAPSRAAGGNEAPHIVIVGIDSLRNDLRIPRRGDAAAPHIHEFLSGARRFTDTTSPLARTYPAWVSILTGRHPVTTNARFNLMPRALVNEGETLPEALRAFGYRSTYATDEVRFANIDKSFGFDRLITPPIGAADFLLGFGGDIPLVNLVAATPAGGWLFPSNHGNRGAYVTYEPDDFIDRLEDEIEVEGPSFMTIHLTLAHWPYVSSGMPVPGQPEEYRVAYNAAVTVVDRQFDEVMRILKDKGVLDNAIVVLLSDHGEALGDETDSMLRKTGTDREIWNSLWGHGTSVLSPHQYSVLLAMRSYGRATLPGAPGERDWPVSLEDVRPTLEEFATGTAPAGVDGISLLPYLADRARVAELGTRLRFTETDFNTPNTLAGKYEASGIIDEAAVYYRIDPASGWVQIKPDKLSVLIPLKQRGVVSRTQLLAAVPDRDSGTFKYLLTDRQNPLPRLLAARPDPTAEPEAARLWDALQARFPGEMSPASTLP